MLPQKPYGEFLVPKFDSVYSPLLQRKNSFRVSTEELGAKDTPDEDDALLT